MAIDSDETYFKMFGHYPPSPHERNCKSVEEEESDSADDAYFRIFGYYPPSS